MGEAAFWGFVAGSSLLIGAVIAWTFDIPRPLIGAVMAFGAGAMISAVSYDLVLESLESGGSWLLAGGLAAGALAFFFGDLIIDSRGGEHRKRSSGEQSSGNGQAIFLGTLLDGIPETFVIGLTLVTGGSVSAAFVASVFMSNLPESMAATSGLKLARWERSKVYRMWITTVVVSIACSAGGYAYYSNYSGDEGTFVRAFAAGALLTMLSDTMLPEAFEYRGKLTGILTVLGFGTAVAISQLQG